MAIDISTLPNVVWCEKGGCGCRITVAENRHSVITISHKGEDRQFIYCGKCTRELLSKQKERNRNTVQK